MKLQAELTPDRKLIYSRDEFTHGLKRLKPGNVFIVITTEKVTDEFKHRSNAENKYYWSVVVKHAVAAISETMGEKITADQAHEILKEQCNGKTVPVTSRMTGEITHQRIGLSTKDMSTVDYEAYLERCRLFLNEWHNCYVPLPNESEPVEYI